MKFLFASLICIFGASSLAADDSAEPAPATAHEAGFSGQETKLEAAGQADYQAMIEPDHSYRFQLTNVSPEILWSRPDADAFATDPGFTLRLSPPTGEEQYQRAFNQQREADVLVSYETGKELRLDRPIRPQAFASEGALLAFLSERKAPKRLLVVILGKQHAWSEPKQTLEGFWRACKQTGFERVVIEQGTAFGRPILRE